MVDHKFNPGGNDLTGTMDGWFDPSEVGSVAVGAHWVTFMVLTLATFALGIENWRAKGPCGTQKYFTGYREQYNIAVYVNMFASISYFGKVVADSVGHNYDNVGPFIIGLGNYKYADYMATCPLLVYDLLAQLRAPYQYSCAMLILAVLLTGAVTNFYPTDAMRGASLAWFTYGCFWYMIAYGFILQIVMKQYKRLATLSKGTDARRALPFLRLAIYTFFSIWIGFPIVWVLSSKGVGILSNDATEILHCIFDLIAKTFYGFALAKFRRCYDKQMYSMLDELGLDIEEEMEMLEHDLKLSSEGKERTRKLSLCDNSPRTSVSAKKRNGSTNNLFHNIHDSKMKANISESSFHEEGFSQGMPRNVVGDFQLPARRAPLSPRLKNSWTSSQQPSLSLAHLSNDPNLVVGSRNEEFDAAGEVLRFRSKPRWDVHIMQDRLNNLPDSSVYESSNDHARNGFHRNRRERFPLQPHDDSSDSLREEKRRERDERRRRGHRDERRGRRDYSDSSSSDDASPPRYRRSSHRSCRRRREGDDRYYYEPREERGHRREREERPERETRQERQERRGPRGARPQSREDSSVLPVNGGAFELMQRGLLMSEEVKPGYEKGGKAMNGHANEKGGGEKGGEAMNGHANEKGGEAMNAPANGQANCNGHINGSSNGLQMAPLPTLRVLQRQAAGVDDPLVKGLDDSDATHPPHIPQIPLPDPRMDDTLPGLC